MPVNIGVIRVFNDTPITTTSTVTSLFIRPVDSGYFSVYVSSTASGTLAMQGSLDNINYVPVALTNASSTFTILSGTAALYSLAPILAPYYLFTFTPSAATGTFTLLYASF